MRVSEEDLALFQFLGMRPKRKGGGNEMGNKPYSFQPHFPQDG